MADLNQLYDALRKADAAGNVEDAKKLADYIRSQSAAPAPTPQKAPEDVGFFESIPAAAKRGVESLGEMATGLGLAAKKVTGDEEAVRKVMAEAKEQKPQEKPGMTVADFERIAKEQGFAAAAAQAPKYIVEQVLQSAPQMAGPLVAGAGAAALSGPLAPIVGPAVGIGTYAVQQFGNFLMRQAQEKKDPEELEVTKAALTAAGTAPLGYFADRFTVGLGGVGKNAGEQVLKELASRRAAGEIGAGAVAKEVGKRAAKGATVGIIAEAPTEVLEQAAERYQAGLELTGADARNEYREAFFGAAAAGGGIGGTSGAARGYAGYRGELGEARAALAPPADTTGQAPPPPPPLDPSVRIEEIKRQLDQIKGYVRDISNVDPSDERITGAYERAAELQNELDSLQAAPAGQEFVARGQMGFDFNAPKEPEKIEVPTDQEMQDAGFTQYEIEQLKKNPWPERYQQIKQGYRMMGGQFRPVTQEDVDQVKQNNIRNQQIKAEKKAQLDEAFAQNPRDGVSQILGSDWNSRFNLTTEEYQKHAYNTLERQYGSIDSGVAMLERRLAAAQPSKPKEEAPGFALTSEGTVPEMEGIEAVPEGERARMMLIGTPNDPTKPLRSFFDNLKSATANPAESVKFKNEVRNFLDEVTEFVGGQMRKQVSRYRQRDAAGNYVEPPPEPPKGQDVGVRLSGPELTRRTNFLNNFFDTLSIAPKERETITSALSQRMGSMSVQQQTDSLNALLGIKNLNTRRGIEELRKRFSDAVDKFERGRIGEAEAEAVLPFKASEDITNLDPYVAAAVSRAIKAIDTSTPEGKAAMAYLGPETGWRYGLAMRSAAFDIGVPNTEASGVTFKNQDTKQAELFKKWIEDNLPQQEYKKFEATVKEFREANRRADQALANANTRKASRIDPSYLKSLYRKPTGKEQVQAIPAGMKGLYTAAGEIKQINALQFAIMHPAIQERIEANDINGALKLIADQKIDIRKKTGYAESPTYLNFISGLAKRLLELNLTTDIVVDQQNKLTAYYLERNGRTYRTQFLQQLELFDWGKDFIAKHNLRGDLNDPAVVRQTLQVLEDIASKKISFGTDDVIPPIAGQFAQLLKTYRDAVANLNSQGFFFSGMNTINLNSTRGGMSTATFLHEVVHAATLYNLIPANYDTLNPAQKLAVDELRELYEYAKKKYEGTAAAGEYGFENIYEFVSEALSNPDFQEFLQVLKYETKYKGGKALSLWNKFIGLVGKLFGLDNVLGKTIVNANAIMRTSTKDDKAVIAYSNAGKYTMNSTMPYNSSQYMGLMNTILNGRLTWSGIKDRWRNVYVGALTLRQISDIIGDKVPKIKDFINSVENMLEYRNNILEEIKSEIKPWQEFQSKSPAKAQTLSKLMIDTTVAKKDPSKRDANGNYVKTGDKLIDDAWQDIGPEGQKIYEDVKLFYKRRYDAYVDMLLENKKLALMADNFTEAEAIASPEYQDLKKHFQEQSIEPYFPLRRFGQYSVRLMSGSNRSFYMFESPEQRDAFIEQAIPILKKKYGSAFNLKDHVKPKNSPRELLYSEDLHNAESLKTLKDIIKNTSAQDKRTLQPNELSLRDNITEAVEQLYLLQIPDQSIRKMFMNRENIPGMDLDMLRAFTSSAFHMAYQHSRFKYSRPIYNSLDAASAQIDEMDPEESKVLSEYMKEIREHRVSYIMNPVDTGKTAARLSNLSFLWFMTSPASAITNMLGVPAVGLPVVGAKFGNAKAFATMTAYSKKVLGSGFKDKDGKFSSPSLSHRLDILSEAQKEAYLRAVADGIIDITLSHDIVGLAETPSALYEQGVEHTVMKYASATFHGAEKFNREVVFMSAFDLAYQKYKNVKGYSEEGARKKAIEIAKELTYKSMFDYSTLNKPRFLQGSIPKVLFQFKQFSQQMSYLLGRSAFEVIYKDFTPDEQARIKDELEREHKLYRPNEPKMTPEQLESALKEYIADFRKEAKHRLLGVYGTTAVFAGASGLPLWWTVSATANALQAVFGDDDDEDWDFDIWFKEWANDTFGGFFGDVLVRGGISQVFGANVADRLSLNDLWFRDARKSPDEVSWVQNQLINLLGPTAGLVINSAEAVKQYNAGYVDRAIETASPALIKNTLKGIRFMSEGRATNLKGDELLGDITGVEAGYQMLGFAPERLAQRQKANIEKKTIEQDILKRQARLKDAFFMSIDNDDEDLRERTLEKIAKFNQSYPELALKPKNLLKSVRGRYERRALAESMGGMTYDKRLIGRLSEFGEYGE
jgi:hypothetical protein